MKKILITFFVILFALAGFSQNDKLELGNRPGPTTSEDKVAKAKLITDLSPLLWQNMELSGRERYVLDHRRENVFPQPEKFNYPQEKYKQVIDYVAVEISTSSNGKTFTARSSSEILTAEQKKLLSTAGLGTDIKVILKYKYKNTAKDEWGQRDNVVEGKVAVTIVPEVEAAFPGGYKQLSEYFASNVLNKVNYKDAADKLSMAIIKFTVNEDGQIANAKLSRATADALIDKLLVEALSKMPKWIPAQNAGGVKVKQEICIPFGGGC
jgi:TonB family protein